MIIEENYQKVNDDSSFSFVEMQTKQPETVEKINTKQMSKNFTSINVENPQIYKIRKSFYDKYENKEQIREFEEKYIEVLNGGYTDLALLIKEFKDFNLFDYINTDNSNKTTTFKERRSAIIKRNNIFLRVLIESHLDSNSAYIPETTFLTAHIDIFTDMLCEKEDEVPIFEIDVDVFFLCVFGAKNKARSVIMKYYSYFKDYVKDFAASDASAKMIFENLFKLSEKQFDDLAVEEIIVLRKIFNNCAKRNFIKGLQFVNQINPFCCCLTEGRIWKNILLNYEPEKVFDLFQQFLSMIKLMNRKDFRQTIHNEYKLTLEKMEDDETEKGKYKFDQKNQERNLNSCYDFKSFLKIAFASNRIDTAFYFIEHIDESELTKQVFEICLMNNEEIAIEIGNKILNNDNAEENYMKAALIRKYFRLAIRLERFRTCRTYLNYHRTVVNGNDESYIYLINKFQREEKKKIRENMEKVKNKIEGNNLTSSFQADKNRNCSSSFNNNLNTEENPFKKTKRIESTRNANSGYSLFVNGVTSSLKKEGSKLLDTKVKRYKDDSFTEKGKNKTTRPVNQNIELDFFDRVIKTEDENKKISKSVRDSEFLQGFASSIIHNPFPGRTDNRHPGIIIKPKGLYRQPTVQVKQDTYEEIKNVEIDVQLVLIENLRWGQYAFPCLCLLSSICERYFHTEYIEKICKSLMVFVTDDDAISKCRYPIIFCVLAAEFLINLIATSSKNNYRCQSVADSLLNLAVCIQSSIKDEETLNYFLREQNDLKKRCALEIIAENRFYELLQDENVASIVGKLWYGKGNDVSLWKYCRTTRILTANIFHESYKEVSAENKINTDVYSFQYDQYTANCSVRYIVDSVSTIATTIFYQFIIYLYVSLTRQGISSYSDETYIMVNNIANAVVISITLNFLMYVLYIRLSKRGLKYNLFFFNDLIMFVGVFCNFIGYPMSLFDPSDGNRNFANAVIYSIIIFCAWMRVVNILLKTRSYGPILRILYLLLSTMSYFLLFMVGFNTLFAQVFTILFKDTNIHFNTFFTSWLSLFKCNFGSVSFDNFINMELLGYTLLMIYTTVVNVMFLNLIVGIINNLFIYLEKQADAENRSVLVLTYERIKWDEEFGLLILLPAPANIFSMMFFLILMFIKERPKREKWNNIFSKICYFIIALANFLMMIFVSFFLLPFSYLKSILHSTYDNISQFSPLSIFIDIFTRPVYLFIFFLKDLYNFWPLVYRPNTDLKEGKKFYFNREMIIILRKKLLELKFIHQKRKIHSDEILKSFKIERRGKRLSTEINSSTYEKTQDSLNMTNSLNRSSKNLNFTLLSNCKEYYEMIIDTSKMTQEEKVFGLCYLIDKLVDRNNVIDIDRTLSLIPSRTKYSDHFIKSLHYTSVKTVLKGVRKNFFFNNYTAYQHSYVKLDKLLNKILIKFKLIYYYLPKIFHPCLKQNFKNINSDEKFSKLFNHLNKLAEQDESDFYEEDEKNTEMSILQASNVSLDNITDLNMVTKY